MARKTSTAPAGTSAVVKRARQLDGSTVIVGHGGGDVKRGAGQVVTTQLFLPVATTPALPPSHWWIVGASVRRESGLAVIPLYDLKDENQPPTGPQALAVREMMGALWPREPVCVFASCRCQAERAWYLACSSGAYAPRVVTE